MKRIRTPLVLAGGVGVVLIGTVALLIQAGLIPIPGPGIPPLPLPNPKPDKSKCDAIADLTEKYLKKGFEDVTSWNDAIEELQRQLQVDKLIRPEEIVIERPGGTESLSVQFVLRDSEITFSANVIETSRVKIEAELKPLAKTLGIPEDKLRVGNVKIEAGWELGDAKVDTVDNKVATVSYRDMSVEKKTIFAIILGVQPGNTSVTGGIGIIKIKFVVSYDVFISDGEKENPCPSIPFDVTISKSLELDSFVVPVEVKEPTPTPTLTSTPTATFTPSPTPTDTLTPPPTFTPKPPPPVVSFPGEVKLFCTTEHLNDTPQSVVSSIKITVTTSEPNQSGASFKATLTGTSGPVGPTIKPLPFQLIVFTMPGQNTNTAPGSLAECMVGGGCGATYTLTEVTHGLDTITSAIGLSVNCQF